jgi:hypothetical protein
MTTSAKPSAHGPDRHTDCGADPEYAERVNGAPIHSMVPLTWNDPGIDPDRTPQQKTYRSPGSTGARTGGSGASIGGRSVVPVMSRVPRPWVMKLQAQRISTTRRFENPIR